MENRYKASLDFKQRNSAPIAIFVQNDVDGNVIEFTILDGGRPMDITGQTVSIAFLKGDSTLVIQDITTGVTVLNGINGIVECVLKSQTLAAVGTCKGVISFSLAGKKLSSSQFTFTVGASLDNGSGLISANVVPALDAVNAQFSLNEAIKGTNQFVTLNGDKTINKVEHKNLSNIVLRTDAFTYAVNLITEIRTLSTGATTTFKYHLDTLETEVI